MNNEKYPGAESAPSAEATYKLKKIQDFIWHSIPKVNDSGVDDLEKSKKVADFIEAYAGKYGPNSEDISLEEAEDMFNEYMTFAGEFLNTKSIEDLYGYTSDYEKMTIKNVQDYIYNKIPNVSDTAQESEESARKVSDFIQKYATQFGPNATEIPMYVAMDMYADFSEIASEYYDMPDFEQINDKAFGA